MKIVIINHSDSRGGASVVSRRLMHALRECGVEASMLVLHKGTDDPHVHVAGPTWRAKAAFLAEHLRIFAGNGFNRDNLFKVSIATDGLPLSQHPLVKEADAVLLGWINQGMLSLKEIGRIAAMGKKVVWTMHDMWNLTGVCHHAGLCGRYEQGPACGKCPFLGAKSERDLSRKTALRKKQLYESADIRFVAVSTWLADKCRQSWLMGDQKLAVIANAFPVEEFSLEARRSRRELGLPEQGKIILMGAARLDDPIKGLPLAVEALNKVRTTDATAVFFGNLRNPQALAGLEFPHQWLGSVSDAATLRDIYAHSDAILSSSHYETLPGTLIEGQAAGCFPVSFGQGGQADIIDSPQTGYIARYPDTDDLAHGIETALSGTHDSENLRSSVLKKFSVHIIARKYLELID